METVDIQQGKTGVNENKNISFCVDALKGLNLEKKSISSKYLYDERGSELFQEITRLKEYYLTEAEESIFEKRSAEIVSKISSQEIDVVELGVGDGHKTKLLLNELMRQGKRIRFYGVDISKEALRQFEKNIKKGPSVEVFAVHGEYSPGLAYARSRSDRQMLVLFLGSNIGNFLPEARSRFLKEVRSKLHPGDLFLTGFDLKKHIPTLMKAYDDSRGVTAKFNLNLLERMNRELGANFNLKKFSHHAMYNPVLGAMESHLISLEEQDVFVEEFGKSFRFDEFEPIHLEYSFKFTKKEIEEMAESAGFLTLQHFYDDQNLYLDSVWEAKREYFSLH